MIKQVITHDKEVLDISFEPTGNQFATVGFDATVRLFDMRDLTKSDIILEHVEPLTRIAFNNFLTNIIAVTSLEDSSIIIIDTRKPLFPMMRLKYHTKPINNIVWAPYSSFGH
jgi:WD40 repeat protein